MSTARVAILLAAALTACSISPEEAPPPSPTPPVATPEAVPTVSPPGPCQHLLWPLVDGASWQYTLALPDGTAHSVALRAAVAGEDAILTIEQDGTSQGTYGLSCAPDGLYGAPGLLWGHPDFAPVLQLDRADGPFLASPDHLLPLGTETSWDARYLAAGIFSLALPEGLVQASVTGTDVAPSEVVLYAVTGPVEPVSVPAGTFNALPVTQSAFINLHLQAPDGATGSLFGDVVSRLYFAEGVGLVKEVYEGGTLSGTLGGSPFAIGLSPGPTLELASYEVPLP